MTLNIIESIDLINTTLGTTAEGLEITRQSLQTAVESVGSLQTTIQSTAKAIDSTLPLMDEVAGLLKDELPQTINAVQSSLATAQQSAKVSDNVLRILNYLSLNAYNPSVPFDQALTQISASMNNLPATFANMEQSLQQTSNQIEVIKAELGLISVSIEEIKTSLELYTEVVDAYQVSVAEVETRLLLLKSSAQTIVNRVILGIDIFLVWMAIAQIGLLTQGMDILRREDTSHIDDAGDPDLKQAEEEAEEEATGENLE